MVNQTTEHELNGAVAQSFPAPALRTALPGQRPFVRGASEAERTM
ncbi:hypothetical protein [Hymenobacter sp. BT188]|nr:hypothetical protein [Hymenobacter sp. BT188]